MPAFGLAASSLDLLRSSCCHSSAVEFVAFGTLLIVVSVFGCLLLASLLRRLLSCAACAAADHREVCWSGSGVGLELIWPVRFYARLVVLLVLPPVDEKHFLCSQAVDGLDLPAYLQPPPGVRTTILQTARAWHLRHHSSKYYEASLISSVFPRCRCFSELVFPVDASMSYPFPFPLDAFFGGAWVMISWKMIFSALAGGYLEVWMEVMPLGGGKAVEEVGLGDIGGCFLVDVLGFPRRIGRGVGGGVAAERG